MTDDSRRMSDSFGALRQLAASEADADDTLAAQAERPGITKLYRHVALAWENAVDLTFQSQRSSGSDPARLIGPFVGRCVRLLEHFERAERLLTKQPELWKLWPTSPGTTFSWKGGDSAASVALSFAHAIVGAVIAGKIKAFGGINIDVLLMTPTPDERFGRWRDITLAEIRDHADPPSATWGTREIHRDRDALKSKLYDEYCRAMNGSTKSVEQLEAGHGEPPARPANANRDAWLYEAFHREEDGELIPYKRIVQLLNAECEARGWNPSSDIKNLKNAANRHAKRNKLPPIPRRQHGKRSPGDPK